MYDTQLILNRKIFRINCASLKRIFFLSKMLISSYMICAIFCVISCDLSMSEKQDLTMMSVARALRSQHLHSYYCLYILSLLSVRLQI